MTSRVHQGYSLTISHPRLHFCGKTINVRTEKDDQEQRPDCLLNKKYKFLSFLSCTHNWISIMCIHFKIIYRRLQPNILINWRCLFPRHDSPNIMTQQYHSDALLEFSSHMKLWKHQASEVDCCFCFLVQMEKPFYHFFTRHRFMSLGFSDTGKRRVVETQCVPVGIWGFSLPAHTGLSTSAAPQLHKVTQLPIWSGHYLW